jgi:hypothetical protein
MNSGFIVRAFAWRLCRIALGFADAAAAQDPPVIAAADRGKAVDRGSLHTEGRIVLFAPAGSALKPDPQFSDLQSGLRHSRPARARLSPQRRPLRANFVFSQCEPACDPYRGDMPGGSYRAARLWARGVFDVPTRSA